VINKEDTQMVSNTMPTPNSGVERQSIPKLKCRQLGFIFSE
jgi:hypothetical protein